MKRLLIGVLTLLTLIGCGSKKSVADYYRYEIESFNGNIPVDAGSVIVKVWNYGSRRVNEEKCMRSAIEGILFKGYGALNNRSADRGKAALVPEGYEAHKEYFDNFFNSGKYLQYVRITNSGQLEMGDVIRLKSGGYKVGLLVVVNYKALRQKLEQDNIIKRLDFLF